MTRPAVLAGGTVNNTILNGGFETDGGVANGTIVSSGSRESVVSGGSMTVAGSPSTAEVTLETGKETRQFTLTKLAWEGDERTAQVHDEGAGSPPVGRFEGTGGQGEVKGSLVSGHSVYKVEFKLTP